MTEEQFTHLDNRLNQLVQLMSVIACNTARNSQMTTSSQVQALKVVDQIIDAVTPFASCQ